MQVLDPYRLRNRPDPQIEDRTVQAALRFVLIAGPVERPASKQPGDDD